MLKKLKTLLPVFILVSSLVFFGCPPEPPDTTAPVLSNGSIDRTSDTAATIGFTTDEAGTAYYVVVNAGATAPTGAEVKEENEIGAVTTGVNSGKSVVLTAGAKDIYVVVEDAAGNISEPLKISVEAYVSPEIQAEAFRTAHATILAKTVGTVDITDEDAVNAALTAYNALWSATKNLLADEKELLDELKERIKVLKPGVVLTSPVLYDGNSWNDQLGDVEEDHVLFPSTLAGIQQYDPTDMTGLIIAMFENAIDISGYDLLKFTVTINTGNSADYTEAYSNYWSGGVLYFKNTDPDINEGNPLQLQFWGGPSLGWGVRNGDLVFTLDDFDLEDDDDLDYDLSDIDFSKLIGFEFKIGGGLTSINGITFE